MDSQQIKRMRLLRHCVPRKDGIGAFRVIVLISLLLFLVGQAAIGATTVRITVNWEEESAYEVQLAKTADAWNDPDNAVGVYDSDIQAYYFEIDLEDFDQWDATSTYKIMEDGSNVLTLLMLGDISVADTLRDHSEAESGVHGATGDVVGTSDTQTLTNKTIDGDDNTLSDIDAWSIKSGTYFPDVSVRPNNGEDTYLHLDIADSDGITIQCSDEAKSSDLVITVIADSVDFQNDGGSDIVLSGIDDGALDNTAVTKGTLDALAARVEALERDDEFSGSQDAQLTIDSHGPRIARLNFWLTPFSDNDSLKRWEVYWSTSALTGISAGATDAAELNYLRENANKVVLHSGEGNNYSINTISNHVWACAVAFDWAETAENSNIRDIAIEGIGQRRDEDGQVVRLTRIIASTAEVAADAAAGTDASEFLEYTCNSASSPDVKFRTPYRFDEDDERLVVYFYAKTGADIADHGYVKASVMDGALEEATETYYVSYNADAYPATPQSLDIDVSGLSNGMLYEIEVTIWSDDGHNTKIKQIMIECESEVGIY